MMFVGFFILFQLNNIDVNETVEGDDRAFEIWHEREDSVRKYTLQARTVTIKNSWLRDLRELQQRYSMPAWSEWDSMQFYFFLYLYCLEFLAQLFIPNYFLGSPDFDEILANCTAELGQTVKLACKVTGVPKPAVTWYKGEAFPLWLLAMWSDIQRLFHEWFCLLVGCRWTRSGGRSTSHHHRGPWWFLHTNPGQYDCRWFWSVHVLCHKSSWQCQYSGKDHSSG